MRDRATAGHGWSQQGGRSRLRRRPQGGTRHVARFRVRGVPWYGLCAGGLQEVFDLLVKLGLPRPARAVTAGTAATSFRPFGQAQAVTSC